MSRRLEGVRVIVGRAQQGVLSTLLDECGAVVLHLPLIAERDPEDGGAALQIALGQLDRYDWLVVTSVAGAERVGAAVGACPSIRLAAVGDATARCLSELAGRPVDVVPSRQLASELTHELRAAAPDPARFLFALADRADRRLPRSLVDLGHDVTVITAYRTVLMPPSRESVPDADVLLLTSGSMAQSWARGEITRTPPIVVAIGPSTARAARREGLTVSAVAEVHSLVGLIDALDGVMTEKRADG